MIFFSFSMLWVTLYGVAIGAFLAGCYDLFRIRRIAASPTHGYGARPHPAPLAIWLRPPVKQKKFSKVAQSVILWIEDTVFGIFCGIVLAVMFFYADHGRIRAHVLVAVGIGFLCYRLTVGRLTVRFADAIVACLRRWINRWMRFLYRITVLPFQRRMGKVVRIGQRTFVYRQRKRYTKRYFQQLPKQMFPDEVTPPGEQERKRIKRKKKKGGVPDAGEKI